MKIDKQKYEKFAEQLMAMFQTEGDTATFAYLDDYIEKNPDFLEAYIVRSEMHAAIGLKHADPLFIRVAFRDLETVIGKAPNDPQGYYHRGTLYARSDGDFDRAIDDLNRAIALDANHVDSYVHRAIIYSKKNEWQKVISDCTKVIELSPDIVNPYIDRGLAYINMDMPSKALADFNKFVELEPDNADAYAKRGFTHSQLGNIQEAISDLEKFLELDPDSERANLIRNELVKLKSGSGKSGGCYVATAVYGSYEAPEVLCLRRFRDETLARSIFGRMFISLYYRFSPPFAEWLKDARHINKITRKILNKFVERLGRKSF